MSIDGPVIIDEHGDTQVYSSTDEAVSGLEAIDVRNGEYVAFDSAGTPLGLLVVGNRWLFADRPSARATSLRVCDVQPVQSVPWRDRIDS